MGTVTMGRMTIAILRRPDRLFALTSDRRIPAAPPRYGEPLLIDAYVEQETSLEEVPDLNRDFLRELSVKWERLSRVSVFNRGVVADIRDILATTIPDEARTSVEPWRPPVVPRPPQATAAHPRAFRGTKSQPPSPQLPPTIDLRPHLCNLRDCRAIFSYLSSLPQYISHSELQEIDTWQFQEFFSLPRPLRSCLWSFHFWKGKTRADWSSLVGQYWALQLDSNEPLRRAVARVLREPWLTGRLSWLEALRHIAPDRREALLVALLECPSRSTHSADKLTNWLSLLSELSDDESLRNRAWALVQAMQRGGAVEALLRGFEMANRYQPDYDFVNKEYDNADATAAIAEWIEHVKLTSDSNWNRESAAMGVWDDCGHLHGLAKLFSKSSWLGLSPDDAYELFRVFQNCRYSDTPEKMQATFAVLFRFANQYFELIRSLPVPYRDKGIRLYRVVADLWEGKLLEQAIVRTLELLPIVCKEPFDKACDGRLYSAMLSLRQQDHEAWRRGSIDSLLLLERASRNSNAATLISTGLNRLARDYSAWVAEAMERSPAALLKCARTFGCLSKTQHLAAMELTFNHPIFCCDATSLRPLASWIVANLPAGVHDPVPRKVKAMLSKKISNGEVVLTEGQQSRALAKIQAELVRTRIEIARQSAIAVLANALGVSIDLAEHRAVAHAVKMQNIAQENRRALRKFLRAYLAGEVDYLNNHSANVEWLRQHPAIEFERWRNGPAISHSSVDGQQLVLSVELNPLEVLQLGSYVGSCLGIGGMLAVSSAAVALDINKTVVYARNTRGKVIARQLLAISEDDKLVAFNVYPDSSSSTIKQAFVEFDRAFAAHLGIELHQPQPDEDSPEIARLISTYWWDDSAWDFEQ